MIGLPRELKASIADVLLGNMYSPPNVQLSPTAGVTRNTDSNNNQRKHITRPKEFNKLRQNVG